ncbi:TetR family transcriptional regulator [Paraoerskovia sediminicola]|uniref:TetR family transcriptional regulator n=1 Tax=Paraoerskovia sediminicola TaxID=1138587 RepID=A0ABN6XDT9_9CELL|nr:TetR/AcrR family transcriptional regulator [Paraoerskovia sediminicola]BDZ41746.1 TetR family transcriptional regulator [Paraoerskovia sediminicola]
MSTPTAATAPDRVSPVRARILDAATELFYAEGVRAVSADRIIAVAEVSKVTFYRHFRTKDDLVVAYLEATGARERELIDSARAQNAGDAVATLMFLATLAGDLACRPGFRGCSFINASAEYPDAAHPVRAVIAAHRAWYTETFRQLVLEVGVDDPAGVADELMMLRDGAMIAGYVGSPDSLTMRVANAGRAILRAHRLS